MSKKKGLELDTQQIVTWCKANIVLVILLLVSIGAVIGLPMVATGMTEQVQQSLKQRASSFKKIDTLLSTNVTPPGSAETVKVAVNQALLDAYVEVTGTLQVEAEEVVSRSVALNKKEYIVFSTALFPAPPPDQRETLPQQFYRVLETEYKQIPQALRAGSPVSTDDLVVYLEDARVRFMETNLSTKQDADLTTEQRTGLEKHLAKLRMARLRTHAEDISVYFEESSLNIPAFDITSIPSVGTMFNWQWRYWVIADILGAIATMNEAQAVLTSPIKQIVMLEVLGMPTIGEEEGATGGGRPSGGGGAPSGPKPGMPPRPMGPGGPSSGGRPSPFGPGGRPSGGKPTPPTGPTGGGPTAPTPPTRDDETGSLAISQTGHVSGALYDVFQVRIQLIVDTQRIPAILDGFSAFNFYTVIDLDLEPEDKFVALADGYDYGPASVSKMTLVLESVWLRSWTTEFMPDAVKKAIGIPVTKKD
jgi:hypothetical protein